MKNKLNLFYAVLTAIVLSATFCTSQTPQHTLIVFNANSITTTEANVETNDSAENHIIIDTTERMLTFINNNGEEWGEKIISCDTIQNIDNHYIMQIWSETSYWELQYLKIDSIYRPYAVAEYPNFGEVDKRLYTRSESK